MSNKRKDGGKITLGMLKGKPVTTSVPSIAIRFHANAEQLEELYGSDEEKTNQFNPDQAPFSSLTDPINSSNIVSKRRIWKFILDLPTLPTVSTTKQNPTRKYSSKETETHTRPNIPDPEQGEPDSSPLKYLPRIVKRSTSSDVSQVSGLDSSPPSDRWKFFSDIKGKITKSVEDKITEIKSRNQEENSPIKKTVKDNKDNLSLSDSEDLSESSISKTCGILSTTEGAEMSSDDDTPSLEKDTKEDTKKLLSGSSPVTSGLRQRFRLLRNKATTKEGTVSINNLSKLYNINTESIEQALPEDSDDVESAVDALEDTNLESDSYHNKSVDPVNVLKSVAQKYDNVEVDSENVLNIKQISGEDIRSEYFSGNSGGVTTVYGPSGFVDLRAHSVSKQSTYMPQILFCIAIVLFIFLQKYVPLFAGIIVGILLTIAFIKIQSKFFLENSSLTASRLIPNSQIFEIPAIKEYQPVTKYEGWVNEYPEVYDPHMYHISQTQSAYLRLQGNLLRISHTRSKIPKRAMWNETPIKANFTHHRIYNMIGAKISLLPEGLAKKRQWSKKYPICITLSKDQMKFDPEIMSKLEQEDEKEENKNESKPVKEEKNAPKSQHKHKKTFSFRKKETPVLMQRFSKLTEEDEDLEFDSDSRASTPSPDTPDVIADQSAVPVDEDNLGLEETNTEEDLFCLDDWSTISPQNSPTDLKLYIFGRTDREKEDWFRRFAAATHNTTTSPLDAATNGDVTNSSNCNLLEAVLTESEYLKYMAVFTKPSNRNSIRKEKSENGNKEKEKSEDSIDVPEEPKLEHVLWLNAFIARVLFDCVRDPTFVLKVRERIQRKLGAIKLPYFIEELSITELSLGKTAPFIRKTGKPVLDERGLWANFDLNYEGLVVLTLQTKLNLMKLKNPPTQDKIAIEVRSAIFNSDVDDSAESSSDDDGPQELQHPVEASSGSSNSRHKFIKMVDKIAESKFFQAATENRYIKKAMEGVSNTDLRLTVEVRALAGTMVLNIPPPPTDRIWVGFRPTPELLLSAHPIVGEKNISFLYVTTWIEKKLVQEFQKIMVIPNMEDFVIPVMNPKLPE